MHHPLTWVKLKLQTLGMAIVLAHIGMLIIVGLYYVLFEAWHPMTVVWHKLVSDSYTRHMIRDVGEGFLGGFLAQQVIWNHFKKGNLKAKRHLLDNIEIKLRIPNIKDTRRLNGWQYASAPLLAVLYAAPGFGAAVLLSKWFHHTGSHLHNTLAATHVHVSPHATSYWEKVRTIWTGAWDKKVIGYGASLCFGRRPMRKVYDDAQLWFAERRVILGRQVRFYHPPTFKARCNAVRSSGRVKAAAGQGAHGRAVGVIMVSVIPIGLAFAGFGYYVLTYIATK